MSTQKGGGKGPALDDILGRARNALNRSQQFRANNPQLQGTNNGAAKNSQLSQQAKKKAIPVQTLMTKATLRQPGTKSPGKKTLVSKIQKERISSSSSEDDFRLLLNPDSRSHESDASDSTITPPTITDTSAKDKRNAKVSGRKDKPSKNEAPRNSPRRSAVKTKDLVEKTIIARGDQMSDETYKVIKSMQMSSKNAAAAAMKTQKSPRTSLLEELYLPPEEDSYTEDFISEIRSVSEGSVEVPKTEQSTVEKPGSEDFHDKDEDSINSHLRSASLSLVDEIRENLQSLEVSDKPSPGHSEEGDEDNPLNEFPDGDLNSEEAESLKSRNIKDLRKGRRSQDGDAQSNNDRSSIAGSTSSTLRSKSLKVSYKEDVRPAVSKSSSKASVSKRSDKTDGGFSTSSFASGSRLSETQSFQRALAKVNLDEESHHSGDTNGNFSPSAMPAKTKPQIKIHQILKEEVYVKELKRLRDLHKKEEKLMKKLNVVKVENYMKAKASEAGIKNYMQPNYTKVLKNRQSKVSESQPPLPSNAVVVHSDFTGTSPAVSNDNSEFQERVSKMDIHHLVQEVVASNERMYNMTIAAADTMAKQHGKDAKLLMKIKRKRDEKLKK